MTARCSYTSLLSDMEPIPALVISLVLPLIWNERNCCGKTSKTILFLALFLFLSNHILTSDSETPHSISGIVCFIAFCFPERKVVL